MKLLVGADSTSASASAVMVIVGALGVGMEGVSVCKAWALDGTGVWVEVVLVSSLSRSPCGDRRGSESGHSGDDGTEAVGMVEDVEFGDEPAIVWSGKSLCKIG